MPTFDDVAAGLEMPLAGAMESQRSIRRLRSDPVDDETLLRCIELAMKAPTASNRQSWEWVVVRDPDVKHQLARLNRQAWSVSKRIGRRQPHPLSADRILEAIQWQADHFEEVPVVVVACLRGSRPLFPPIASASFYASIYPAVQNLLLAARGLGLGATLTTLPLWSTALVRRTRPPALGHAVRSHPAGLAPRPLRADDPAAPRRGRAPRPIREPTLRGVAGRGRARARPPLERPLIVR